MPPLKEGPSRLLNGLLRRPLALVPSTARPSTACPSTASRTTCSISQAQLGQASRAHRERTGPSCRPRRENGPRPRGPSCRGRAGENRPS